MSDRLVLEDMTFNTLLHGGTHTGSIGDVSYNEQLLNESLFLESVSQHLKCSICLDVMSQPVQCPKGHSYCKHCIFQVLRHKKVCPICRIPVNEAHLVINRAVEGVIQDLLLRCPTTLDSLAEDSNSDGGFDPGPQDIRQTESSEGKDIDNTDTTNLRRFSLPWNSKRIVSRRCPWTGHVHACQDHLSVCPYARVHCPQPHCNVSLPREALLAHSARCGTSPDLFFHLYTLARCGSQDAWQQLQQHASVTSSMASTTSTTSSSPAPLLAVAYTALVYIHSQISTIPKNLTKARELLTTEVISYLKQDSEPKSPEDIPVLERDRVREGDSSSFPPHAHASFVLATLYQVGKPLSEFSVLLSLSERMEICASTS